MYTINYTTTYGKNDSAAYEFTYSDVAEADAKYRELCREAADLLTILSGKISVKITNPNGNVWREFSCKGSCKKITWRI